eukprot:Pgem_evm1s11838
MKNSRNRGSAAKPSRRKSAFTSDTDGDSDNRATSVERRRRTFSNTDLAADDNEEPIFGSLIDTRLQSLADLALTQKEKESVAPVQMKHKSLGDVKTLQKEINNEEEEDIYGWLYTSTEAKPEFAQTVREYEPIKKMPLTDDKIAPLEMQYESDISGK